MNIQTKTKEIKVDKWYPAVHILDAEAKVKLMSVSDPLIRFKEND